MQTLNHRIYCLLLIYMNLELKTNSNFLNTPINHQNFQIQECQNQIASKCVGKIRNQQIFVTNSKKAQLQVQQLKSQDSDCDSMVSFQKNILLEHENFLKKQIGIFLNYFLQQSMIMNWYEINQYSFCDQCQNIEEYISQNRSLIPYQEVDSFLDFLRQERHINNYLDWIFKQCSRYVSIELVLAVFFIHKWHKAYHHLALTTLEILELSKNTKFINSIYAAAPFHLLKCQIIDSNRTIMNDERSSLKNQFLFKFTATTLFIFEGYFSNPFYQKNKIQSHEITKKKRIRILKRRLISKKIK